MNINNNFTPLAWHQGNIELQSNRASYAFGHIVPLFASSTTFIPFQIMTVANAIDLTTCDVRLRKLDGTDAMNANIRDNLLLSKVNIGPYDFIIYNRAVQQTPLPVGQYYLTITSNNTTWYSDVVTIVSDTSKMTMLTWYDDQSLGFNQGAIIYRWRVRGETMVYKNIMYFLEEIGMPEYTVEEEGETRDGLFYASKILSGKKYKMQVAQLSEAMCDALRFVHLSDHVEVRDGYGRHYQCDSVLVTPEWQTGAVASASVEIVTDTFVKTLGTGYEGESPVVQGATGVIGEGVIGETFTIGE